MVLRGSASALLLWSCTLLGLALILLVDIILHNFFIYVFFPNPTVMLWSPAQPLNPKLSVAIFVGVVLNNMFNFVSVLFLDLWDRAWFRVGSARKLGIIVGVLRDKLTFMDCPVTFVDMFRGSEGVVAGFWVRFMDRKGSNLLWFKFGVKGDNE